MFYLDGFIPKDTVQEQVVNTAKNPRPNDVTKTRQNEKKKKIKQSPQEAKFLQIIRQVHESLDEGRQKAGSNGE